MTDGLRMSHLRKAPQVGFFEVGLPDIYPTTVSTTVSSVKISSCDLPKKELFFVPNLCRITKNTPIFCKVACT